ncbi:hypothetical protein [Boseongicola sp. H5]|uniref:hypothetical protein n=1 Tax=Boseongicola sp. H5 TaxID=2763261 RepID=UPI001D0A4C97|nr:hypothetical protein [Boseongicola sp. H5]
MLSVAVASGKVGYALFVGQRLTDWGTSRIAGVSTRVASRMMARWLVRFQPDVVITESIPTSSRKGQRSREITAAMALVARNKDDLLDVTLERVQAFPNKYDEAEALAVEFPELEPYLPKRRRLWDTESPRTILFEAVALAKLLFADPAPVMARAMG